MFYVFRNRRERISEGYPTEAEAREALISGKVKLSDERAYCGFDQNIITIQEKPWP